MFPSQETTTYTDSKYVASILSSMASGDPAVTSSYHVPNFLTSMAQGAGTTPTLTPTTLANLEQTFIELQSVPVDGSGANNGNTGGMDPHTQSGFVPPVVGLSSRDESQDSYSSDEDEWDEPVGKRGRGSNGGSLYLSSGGDGSQSSTSAPQRKYTRRSRNEKLTPEEDQRRRVRRERNKLAAAKCRQRRVDHTNCLVEETEKLESERGDLETEIQTLQQEKDQLEFLLQSHVPVCKVSAAGNNFKVKAEPLDVSMATARTSSSSSSSSSSAVAMNLAYSSSSCSSMSSSASARPSSLALLQGGGDQRGGVRDLPVAVSCAPTGIPLTTPSNGLFNYSSLDGFVEGSTGLTPLGSTGMTPLTTGPGSLGSTGLTPLVSGPMGLGSTGLTPLASGPGVSCASQVHRSESESGSEAVSSPTLVSL